tara:strand:- start:270 stop:395 length:126 start_codon:yes stop_codon:yes gene_type:complete
MIFGRLTEKKGISVENMINSLSASSEFLKIAGSCVSFTRQI